MYKSSGSSSVASYIKWFGPMAVYRSTKVALLGVEGDRFGLIVTDASGGSERFLAPVSGTNHPLPSSGERLAWSPDSSSIAYMSSEPGPESADATGDPVVIRRYLYKPTAATGTRASTTIAALISFS